MLLYEGSQASLHDMATRQTATLGRVVALRNGILGVLKQNFPDLYSQAERQLGHRLGSRTDQDSVLLAFLDAFVRTSSPVGARIAPPATAVDGLDELRAALAGMGVNVPAGANLRAWADTVNQVQAHREDAVTQHVNASPGLQDGDPHGEFEHDTGTPMEPGDDEGFLWRQELDDAYTDPSSGMLDDATTTNWDLGNLFEPDSSPPTPNRPPVTNSVQDPVDLINELYAQHSGNAPAKQDDMAPIAAAPVAPDAPDPTEAPSRGRARTQATVLKPEMFPAAQVPRSTRTKKTTPRTPRVTAAAPGVSGAGTATDPLPSEAGVATDRFAELYELVTQPRPVFVADLVKACGSPGLVDAWQRHNQDQGTNGSVTVISPRGHNRPRGELVIPRSQDLRDKFLAHGPSLWLECVEGGKDRARLRGHHLYEVALVLHRYLNDVVSSKFTGDVLSMRVNSPTGLVGIVMWLGNGQPAGAQRTALIDAIGELIHDRLTLLAVLTHVSGPASVERLAEAVAEDVHERGWKPTTNLVAARSWDFATDGGAAAISIL